MISLYEQYEKNSKSAYNRQCIDGKVTGCGNCVGYCQCEQHPGFLTDSLRNEHNCIEKQYFHYIPKTKTIKKVPKDNVDISSLIVQLAIDEFSEFEGMRVIRALKDHAGEWILHYVAICEDYMMAMPIKRIAKTVGCNVRMNRLCYDFDLCAKLIFNC